ncbi:MAG: DNA translocase FtsK [Bacteroidales bacterium]|nr:DNA translocase FtsK [Bacteroidales bacterium]
MNGRESISRIIGLVLLGAAAFSAIAFTSYLIHWREDMSIMSVSAEGVQLEAANAAGRLGHTFSLFMIGKCFGVGSYALIAILVAVGIRLLAGRFSGPVAGTVLLSLIVTAVTSLTGAYIGKVFRQELLFGYGPGGRCGAYVISKADAAVGTAVTGLILAIIIISLLFLYSGRFRRWFARLVREPAPSTTEGPDRVPAGTAEGAVTGENPDTSGAGAEATGEETAVPAPDTGGDAETETAEDGTENAGQTAADGQSEGVNIVDSDVLDVPYEELSPIDNRIDQIYGLAKYKFPSIELLESHSSGKHVVSEAEIQRNNCKIRAVLNNYRIKLDDVTAIVGPTVTLYKVIPAPGVKIADIKKLQEDIAISLGAKGVRVVTLTDAVGIEVANDFASMVPLKALLNNSAFRESKANLPVAIGYTITQKVKVFDLTDAPHLLIAGATKQGKSVGLNVIVSSLLYSCHPSELKFVFIDPKMVEFSAYNSLLYHYMACLPENSEEELKAGAVVKTPKRAEKILRSLCIEMDERYELLSKAGVNNIKLYNEKFRNRKLHPKNGHKFLPYLVVVVDEYADLTMTTGASPEARAASRSITNSIIRLAQKGRAAGLHVILATQRPSVDVISGIIKSNFPMRIAFRVASRVDSQTILDAPGAEKLIGNGDMLFSAGIDTERIQCGYVSGKEIDAVTEFIGRQTGYARCYNTPYYLPEAADGVGDTAGGAVDMSDLDERFEEAANAVVLSQKGSTSDIQRKLGMGYAKAGRIMDQLEAAGIVGPQEGSKPRQVLVPDLDSLQEVLAKYRR